MVVTSGAPTIDLVEVRLCLRCWRNDARCVVRALHTYLIAQYRRFVPSFYSTSTNANAPFAPALSSFSSFAPSFFACLDTVRNQTYSSGKRRLRLFPSRAWTVASQLPDYSCGGFASSLQLTLAVFFFYLTFTDSIDPTRHTSRDELLRVGMWYRVGPGPY